MCCKTVVDYNEITTCVHVVFVCVVIVFTYTRCRLLPRLDGDIVCSLLPIDESGYRVRAWSTKITIQERARTKAGAQEHEEEPAR